jgi:ribonuclease D
VLVDPLADLDLRPLVELVFDPAVEKIAHAPEGDLAIFRRLARQMDRESPPIPNVIDTQLAAAFLGLGSSISYRNLIQSTIRVKLPKGAAFTNWLSRPLTAEQEKYALNDVRHLLPAWDRLERRLKKHGRLEWLHEELEADANSDPYNADPRESWRRVSRITSLAPEAFARARTLAEWRERKAREIDIPRRQLLQDRVLIELARVAPKTREKVRLTRALGRAGRYASEIVDVLSRPEDAPPVTKRATRRPRLDSDDETVVAFAQAVLRSLSRAASIDATLVAKRDDLALLVEDVAGGSPDPGDHPLLAGWRGELVGGRLLAFLRGELAVRIDPESNGVRFEGEAPPGE